jgi:acyl carrier protein
MSVDREQLQNACLATIAEELDVPLDTVTLTAHLRDDLDVTSLDAMNIIMSLEDQFQTEADIETVLELQTVTELIDYLEAHLSAPIPPPSSPTTSS